MSDTDNIDKARSLAQTLLPVLAEVVVDSLLPIQSAALLHWRDRCRRKSRILGHTVHGIAFGVLMAMELPAKTGLTRRFAVPVGASIGIAMGWLALRLVLAMEERKRTTIITTNNVAILIICKTMNDTVIITITIIIIMIIITVMVIMRRGRAGSATS